MHMVKSAQYDLCIIFVYLKKNFYFIKTLYSIIIYNSLEKM